MKLGSERWLRVVFVATAVVFAGVAIYLYAFRFFAWLESDAAVQVLLAAKALHAHSPIVGDWYYANGDVWCLTPHLLALLPVAILGAGPASLLISVVVGFALELVVFVKCYRRLCGEMWIAVFAAMATMMAWSNAHAAYEYIQLAYGWVTCLYVLSFTWFATLADHPAPRPWQLVAVGLLVALIAVQNPTRALVYDLVPVLAACAWPWRSLSVRRRLVIGVAATAGWIAAYVVYTWVVSPAVVFSTPRGHLAFAFGDVSENLATFGRGLVLLCAGGKSAVRAIPGVLVVVGALVFVSREVLGSRAFSPLRFVSVIVIAQLGVVIVPIVVGNLLDGREAIRYVMPSLLAMLGLAVVIAVRTLADATWWRRLAMAWLVAVPVAALVAALDTRPPRPRKYAWPDAAELSTISDELVRRGLTHGFSINLGAGLLTVDSSGAAHTCPVVFGVPMVPQRWLTEAACFDASTLPDRFYVVIYQADDDRASVHATLPPEIERFSVGPTYEVYVYRTTDRSTAWLDEGKR